jgi:hypothetical protein
VWMKSGAGIVTNLRVISDRLTAQLQFRHNNLSIDLVINGSISLSALHKLKHCSYSASCAFCPRITVVPFSYKELLSNKMHIYVERASKYYL